LLWAPPERAGRAGVLFGAMPEKPGRTGLLFLVSPESRQDRAPTRAVLSVVLLSDWYFADCDSFLANSCLPGLLPSILAG
jgi:hypothetical protein